MLAFGCRLAVVASALLPMLAYGGDAAPVRSLLEIRRVNVVVQQWDTSCGAAALATVLTYQLGDPVSEKQVAAAMVRRTGPDRVRTRGGFSLLDMKRYAEGRGFEVAGYAALSIAQLAALAPAIVPLHLDGYDHFVVFRGAAGGRAVVADPGYGNRTLTLSQFEKAWNGRIGFVVRSRDASTRVNRMAPRKSDFTGVEEEAVQASDRELPRPLNDWELARLPFNTAGGSNATAAGQAASIGWRSSPSIGQRSPASAPASSSLTTPSPPVAVTASPPSGSAATLGVSTLTQSSSLSTGATLAAPTMKTEVAVSTATASPMPAISGRLSLSTAPASLPAATTPLPTVSTLPALSAPPLAVSGSITLGK